MKKKILWFIFMFSLLFSLASCDKKDNVNNEDKTKEVLEDKTKDDDKKDDTPEVVTQPIVLEAPTIRLNDKTVTWEAVENATGYIVVVNGTEVSTQTTTSYVLNETAVGEYVIMVKAISSDEKYSTSNNSSSVKITIAEAPVVLKAATLWVVGDSTVCNYPTLDNSLYPRYGYGTQLGNYLSDKITVKNLALSGRSSLSFLKDKEYETLKNGITEGDFLVIGFGHNDEKSEDTDRFASANLATTEKGSFKYNLYEYYIKLAEDKKATPILCTPIVRLDKNNNYTGSVIHVTENGDYAKAIVELGEEKSVDVVNLRDITKNLYTTLGFNEAVYFHSITKALSDQYEPNLDSYDKTHINIYGAKRVAYEFAKAISNTNSKLKPYVLSEITMPTKENDLVKYDKYVYLDYSSPNLSTYQPSDNFKTTTAGWYGTAFGNMSGDSTSPFTAKENADSTFTVASTSSKGKFESGGDGIAYLFTRLDANKNFVITADATVVTKIGDKQGGFGLMLRDDCFINVTSKNTTLNSNFAAAGFITSSSTAANVNFERRATSLIKGTDVVANLDANATVSFKIERIGQKVICTTIYAGKTYVTEFLDNPYTEVDTNYIYVGMFANRSANVTFSNVVLTITGDSQGA